MVTLVEAPRGLDMPVGSVALVDADDVRLGLAVGAGSADLFFLLGVADAEAVRWLEQQFAGTGRVPAAIFVKDPPTPRSARAVALGTAVVAVDPRARWESLYRLVNHAFEHHGDRGDRCTTRAPTCSGSRSRSPTAPAAWSASRTSSPTCWRTQRPATKPTNCAG